MSQDDLEKKIDRIAKTVEEVYWQLGKWALIGYVTGWLLATLYYS